MDDNWEKPMSFMYDLSSGRRNFDVVKAENNTSFVSDRRNKSSPFAHIIRRQTNAAIHTAINDRKQEIQPFIRQHIDVTCDRCSQSPIIGDRYKCMFCPNIDFCSNCKSLTTPGHDSRHPLIYISDSNLYTSSIYIQNMNQFIHQDTYCQCCFVSPIVGIRYRCVQCQIDLCQKCEFRSLHDLSHKLLKIVYPEQIQHRTFCIDTNH